MSNVATVQQIYQAFGRGDIPAILERFADDVEFDDWDVDHVGQGAGVPWLVRRSGQAGAAEFFETVAATLEFHSFEPLNILEGGNQVAATIKIDVTVKDTGVRVQDVEIHLWTFDDAGKISGMRHYVDTAKHIKAAKGSLAEVS